MSKKYTYARSYKEHILTAVEFDSFDEARRAVDRGIYDLKIQEKIDDNRPSNLSKPEQKIINPSATVAPYPPSPEPEVISEFKKEDGSGGSSTPVIE